MQAKQRTLTVKCERINNVLTHHEPNK